MFAYFLLSVFGSLLSTDQKTWHAVICTLELTFLGRRTIHGNLSPACRFAGNGQT